MVSGEKQGSFCTEYMTCAACWRALFVALQSEEVSVWALGERGIAGLVTVTDSRTIFDVVRELVVQAQLCHPIAMCIFDEPRKARGLASIEALYCTTQNLVEAKNQYNEERSNPV